MKNKGIKIAIGIFFVMFLLDIFSTVISWELVEHLESNPLFGIGGLPLIIIINILITAGYYFWYKKIKNPFVRYTILYTLFAISLTRIGVVYNNFLLHQSYVADPVAVVEAAKAVTTAMKQEFILKYVVLPNVLPMFAAFISFIFFKKDHNIEVK